MIIMMLGLYHDIEVGDRMYLDVSLISWKCWKMLFRWLYEEGIATPSLFQSGWAVEV